MLGYLINEGFKNTFKNKKSTIASLGIMIATMLIFGLFFVIEENINNEVSNLEEQQGVAVFLVKEATEEQVTTLGEQLNSLDYVKKVTFVSKEDGLKSLKEKWKDKKDILDGYLTHNPLSDEYIITLTDLSKASEVKDQILKLDNVKNVEAKDQTINKLISLSNGVRIGSIVVFVLLALISIFIIANTIKLTVHARRKEISIMKYVGATNGFIRTPFVVEGVLIGVVAAVLSIALVGGIYNWITTDKIATFEKINIQVLTFAQMFNKILIVYLCLGIGIGIVGSLISMRKYLDV